MKLQITAVASERQKKFSIDLSDIDITDDQWEEMTLDERSTVIQKEIDGFDQPFWSLESIVQK